MYVLQMILGVMDVRLNGRFNHRRSITTLHRHHLFVDLDTVWIEKQEGNESGITPAVPVQDIHMPHGSIIPFIMSVWIVYCRIWCNVPS